MATSGRTTRRIVGLAVALAFLASVVGLAWYLRSEHFRQYVRARVIAEIETATGGSVEIEDLRWNLSQLEVEMRGLTIHGLETGKVPPFVHADHLRARFRVLSFLGREVALSYLSVERPAVHIIVYEDGTTNQPHPKVFSSSGKTPVEQLFELAIERAELRDGVVVVNEHRIPLDVSGNDVVLEMQYDPAAKRYDGSLHAGKIDAAFRDYRPFAAQADLRFRLFPTRAEFQSINVKSGGSRLDASARVDDFRNFKFDVNYKGVIDLKELAVVSRHRDLRGGSLQVEGVASYVDGGFQSDGKSSVKNLSFENAAAHWNDLDANARFHLTPERLQVLQIRGRFMDGSVTGNATIDQWGDARQQRGSASLQLSRLAIAKLVNAFFPKKLQLHKLNAVGAVTGEATLGWHGSPADFDIAAKVDITPPVTAEPGQLPIGGNFRGSYKGGPEIFDVNALVLETPKSSVTASGAFGRTRANMKLALNAADLSEFRPLIDAVRGPTPLPIDVGGRSSFVGTISGPFRAPQVAGRVEIADFSTTVALPSYAGAPRNSTIRWDTLSTDLRYSAREVSAHDLVLRRGNTEVRGQAVVGLTKGDVTDASLIQAQLAIAHADVADLQSILGYSYPVSGTLNANFTVTGTRASPAGNGQFSLTNAMAYGESIQSLKAGVLLSNDRVQVSDIRLTGADANITGTASYTISARAYTFDLRGSNVQISNLEFLKLHKVPFGGAIDFHARGTGTLDEPSLNAELNAVALRYQGQKIGDVHAQATTHGSELQITGRSSFENAAVNFDGTVHLRAPYVSDLRLTVADLDVSAYLPRQFAGHMMLAGSLQAKGPLQNPRTMRIDGDLSRLSTDVENVHIANSGPVSFRVVDQVLSIGQFHLIGDGTDFTADGSAELRHGGKLALRANGAVNMKLLHSFSPDLIASGMTGVSLTIGGTTDQPNVLGEIKVSDGAISYVDLPNGLSNITGTLVFSENRLQVEQLTARTGGGQLKIGGSISYGRTLSFNLTASGKDIRLRYPPGISSTADAELTLSGTLKNSLLAGDITVTRFGLNPDFDIGAYAAKVRQPAGVTDAESPLSNLRVDVHVISTPELNVQTSLARVSGNVDLRLRGTAARPSVLGRIGIVRGDVLFNATKYNVERGEITFTNAVKIEPVLDVEASARVRDYDINIGFHGSVDKLTTTYRSDPPLPTGDIIALLALGRTREESANPALLGQQSTTFTESASNAILGQALNATVSNRAQKLFGISRIKIDPQVGGPENNPNARLTIEQQVANNITLTYITNLAQSAQQVIQVEYNVNRDISIIAVRDENGVVGFDVRIRKRKR